MLWRIRKFLFVRFMKNWGPIPSWVYHTYQGDVSGWDGYYTLWGQCIAFETSDHEIRFRW